MAAPGPLSMPTGAPSRTYPLSMSRTGDASSSSLGATSPPTPYYNIRYVALPDTLLDINCVKLCDFHMYDSTVVVLLDDDKDNILNQFF